MQVSISDVHHFEAYVEYRPFRGPLCYQEVELMEAITVMLKEVKRAKRCAFDLFIRLESLFQCIRFMLGSCPGVVLAPPSTRSHESTPSHTHLNLSLLSLLMMQFILNIIYNDKNIRNSS